MTTKNIPEVKVFKETSSNFVIICPYCNKKHLHGKDYGHRASHCDDYLNGGYTIVK